ncbi:LOW QUALITY PROTEIN: uncharacterized protein LOC116853627 [Odontomachus brunneus]|uniref:LOW QUALITY PROTEIN: uncharacterized protein LOC116853627 n=1 Tax=Odontomachus brunneus TaxID=486640 RepID=UPI0013F2A978|nr:LOW QUALITY PROTEIN: uncharacterized protein LOC116853627 [Odontomachus brunneus]
MRPLRGDRVSASVNAKELENVDETGDSDDNDDDVRTDRKGRTAFIFYDFETRQDEMLKGCANVKTHVVTLCVAQQTCEACLGEDDMASRYDVAGAGTILHNAAAFDSQFILRYLVESGRTDEPKVILNGTKIVLLTVGRTKFLDSANYMPMQLSTLPKAFGLKDSVAKGVFPQLFNTIENQNYIGPLPDIDYYSPDTMKSDEREQFLTWHAEMTGKNAVFNFQQEIVRYCRNDGDILRRACLAYRKIFLDRGNVCPFEECTTIASTCMKVFRKNFLREKEIGIIPLGGYRGANAQSRKALQWLLQMEHELGRTIIHAGRGRERHLSEGTLVDGYYETENPRQRHVLQFHGCFWHGCPECFRVNRDRPLSTVSREDTIEARYERTLTMTCRLRKRGYVVMEKWECIFDMYRELRENHEICEFVENHPMLRDNPLEPREAFYGGRMENIVTQYEVTGTEKIRYVDVCSLYPYVLKTGTFPLGHPYIYCCALTGAGPDFNFDAVEDLVRCRVLAPRDFFHPVLPYHVNGKLLFALCRSCCETFSQAACTHDDPADHEFEGAWVSCELRKAIEKDYRVTSQEASGWPNECANDEGGKERYLREYEKVEGIVLNRVNISPNLALDREALPQLLLGSIKALLLAEEKLKRGEETAEDKTVIKLRFNAIRRTVFHNIVTKDETKSCIPVLLKRSFNDNGYSVPYGYVSSE